MLSGFISKWYILFLCSVRTKYINDFMGDNLNAKIIHEQGLYFGNNPELTEEEIGNIVKIFTV